MTAAAPTSGESQVDWRIIVGGGAKLGILTAAGVAVFSVLSTMTEGSTETIIQSALVLIGLIAFAFLPAVFYRPTDTDSIAWTAMIGLLGALFFTVIDTAVLRPLDMYHWTWDAIGGGSGFWYVPVWFMCSAVLAWLGSWVVANYGAGSPIVAGVKNAVLGIVVAVALIFLTPVPFHAAGIALGFALALILHVPISAKMKSG
jgi:hypothetical protein